MEEELPLGSRFVDWVEDRVEDALEIPLIRQGVQIVGGGVHFVDQNLIKTLRYASEEGEVSPEAALGTVIRAGEYLIEKGEEGGEWWAEQLGVDPRIGRFAGGGVVETALTAGAGRFASAARKLDDLIPPGGMTPALATVSDAPVLTRQGGGVRLDSEMLSPTVLEARVGGRGRFVSQGEFDSQQVKQMIAVQDELDEVKAVMENLETANRGISKSLLRDTNPEYKAAVRKFESLQAKLSSEESNIVSPSPGNEFAFPRDTPRAKEIKFETRQANDALGRQMQQLEMHHLIPKGISAAIYNRVRDFIEADAATLKDLHRISDKFRAIVGIDTGDLESNILAMRKTPHSTFHQEMRYQPSATFPTERLEISKQKLTAKLRKIKNMSQLEDLLDGFLENDIKPLVQDAKNWENMDDLLRSVSPKYTGNVRYKPKK
tara:strand:+ start:215 stop:1513 length:1299 start_codon:yes stop_codon:yes gene_type:complete